MKIDTNISNALVLIEEIMQLSGMYTKAPRSIGIFTTNLNWSFFAGFLKTNSITRLQKDRIPPK